MDIKSTEGWRSRFAENMREFGGYSIGKLLDLLGDPDIISLAGGLPSPDMFLKEEMRAASKRRLEEDIERIMQYTPIQGEKGLLSAIIDFLRKDGIEIEEENLLVTTSGEHGLDLMGRLFLDPGDGILLDRPSFGGAIVAFEMQRPVFLGVDIEEDGSNIDGFREILENRKDGSKKPKYIYVVPDFQNPSGITMSLEKREALLDLSEEYDIPILEDSPYRGLRYHGKHIPSLFSLAQKRGMTNIIGCYTFSKMFCPGLRVGFNIGPKAVIDGMLNIKEGNVLNTPKYNQDICESFLREMNYEDHLARCRDYYREKLDIFLETMEKTFTPDMGVTWTRPEGGLFLWVTVPEHIDTKALFYDAVKFKVAFVPGEVFYGANPATNHMRINFSYPTKDQLTVAAERLAGCIRNRLQS